MYVISANYLDRNSEDRWLVRKHDEPIEAAVPCRFVKASGRIRFRESVDREAGFGCTMVALAEAVEIDPAGGDHNVDLSDRLINLEFNGWEFLDEDSGRDVTRKPFERLTLLPDGSMSGVLAVAAVTSA